MLGLGAQLGSRQSSYHHPTFNNRAIAQLFWHQDNVIIHSPLKSSQPLMGGCEQLDIS
jgi:hypothetical protein